MPKVHCVLDAVDEMELGQDHFVFWLISRSQNMNLLQDDAPESRNSSPLISWQQWPDTGDNHAALWLVTPISIPRIKSNTNTCSQSKVSGIMRLINTSSLELEEFLDDRAQTYAILSHRWEDDEVSLQDMQKGTENAKKKHGFAKIKRCCELAKESGLRYAWVDTCCIDKTSSAELSEAINSMYRWYQNAFVCYAYLFDVRQLQGEWEWDVQKSDFRAHFLLSAWWTRGWSRCSGRSTFSSPNRIMGKYVSSQDIKP
jgi:hypothetical protein